MWIRSFLLRVALVALLTGVPAQALQLIVWDPQLQTKLGYGEVVAGKLNLQLVQDYSGPVVALFARDASEKNLYAGLQPRYDGTLRSGNLTLEAPENVGLARFLQAYRLTLNLLGAKSLSLPGLRTLPADRPAGGAPAGTPSNK